jgi:Phage major capsid protein E
MPNPVQSDLHVNAPLTNVSVAYIPKKSDYIATQVFPVVPVMKQSDLYWKYTKSDWRRTDVQKRAPGTRSPRTGYKVTSDTYYAQVFSVAKPIDDQTRANADSNFKLEKEATEFVTNQLLLRRELDFVSTFLSSGSGWAVTYTGVVAAPGANQFLQWNDAGSDPLSDIADWKLNFRELNGFDANTLVLGPRVRKALKNHPDIIDRIKYTQKGVLTDDLLAALLDVDRVFTMYATQAAGAQINDPEDQDAAATYSFIADAAGKSCWFGYVSPSPSLMQPTAGYTFTWKGYAGNDEGVRIKRYREEDIESDTIEGGMAYAMKQVATDMGVYVATAVA